MARRPETTVKECMKTFVAAWPRADAAAVSAFFAEDAIYQNVPLEPVRGRKDIEAAFAGFMAMGGRVSVDLMHLLSDNTNVMTERVDHFVREDRRISVPIMGICEVHDGLITAWRDYFDLNLFDA